MDQGIAPFGIPLEYRPGRPMLALTTKVPQEDWQRIDAHARRIGCHRSALVRALLRQALEQLEQAPDRSHSAT